MFSFSRIAFFTCFKRVFNWSKKGEFLIIGSILYFNMYLFSCANSRVWHLCMHRSTFVCTDLAKNIAVLHFYSLALFHTSYGNAWNIYHTLPYLIIKLNYSTRNAPWLSCSRLCCLQYTFVGHYMPTSHHFFMQMISQCILFDISTESCIRKKVSDRNRRVVSMYYVFNSKPSF